jgi:hypothetical protein
MWTALVLTASLTAGAQPGASLLVVVKDPSGLVVTAASVVIRPAGGDADDRSAVARSTVDGTVAFDDLAPGRYALHVEVPGFEAFDLATLHLKSGRNRYEVVLRLPSYSEQVAVQRPLPDARLDRWSDAFASVLGPEQIAALPDDVEEMADALRELAPPGAVFRVDGFSGVRLPPKSRIRYIRIPHADDIAPENHGGLAGSAVIDIVTQPGFGPLAASVGTTLRGAALNARNPLTESKGDEGSVQPSVSLGATIVPSKVSATLDVSGLWQRDPIVLLPAVPALQPLGASADRPHSGWDVLAGVDIAAGSTAVVRLAYADHQSDISNMGVGVYDKPERAYTQSLSDRAFRVSDSRTVGGRLIVESHFQARQQQTDAVAVREAPTIRVLDAFTSGGAQRAGTRSAVDLTGACDVDWLRPPHAVRVGVLVDSSRFQLDDRTNYFGTYTFPSTAAFLAGKPSSFTQRVGDPEARFAIEQYGLYAQDEYRLSRTAVVTIGVRSERQSVVEGWFHSPRLMWAWTPGRSRHFTVRATLGRFSDWLDASVYEQTIRIDGTHQRDINIVDPDYPVPGAGAASPGDRFLLPPGFLLPRSTAATLGLDQAIGALHLSATYVQRRNSNLERGRNLNAPDVNGVRPDPTEANVIAVVPDAGSVLHRVGVNANWVRKWDVATAALSVAYYYSRESSDTAGAFVPPANGDDLSAEWGPEGIRHRLSTTLSARSKHGLGISIAARSHSGLPYTVTTGVDENRDGLFNDRPVGVGRNASFMPAQYDTDLRVSYVRKIASKPLAPGTVPPPLMSGPGGPGASMLTIEKQLELYVLVQNLFNLANESGYGGVMTSPYFGRPTAASSRRITLGMRRSF